MSAQFETGLNKEEVLLYLTDFSLKYPKEQWWVSYKAALVLYGVFETTNDIDLYGYDELCKKLIQKGYKHEKAPYDNATRIYVNERLEVFSYQKKKKPALNIMYGFQVATLEDIFNHYMIMNRPKDQDTLRRISERRNNIR